MPRKFPVLATRVDAWNKFSRVPIGAVYLRRTSENQLQAFNVVCPHAGCFVDFLPDRGKYLCPCHNSTFTVAGKIDDPASHYKSKTVRVSGTIVLFRDKPQIAIEDVDSIKIVDEKRP